MSLDYSRTQISVAQSLKLLAPMVSIAAFIIAFFDISKWFFQLTRPCAYYQICDLIIILSVLIFTVVSSLPMMIRFANAKLKKNIVLFFISSAMTASVSYLFVEALDSPFFILEILKYGDYLVNDIIRAVFFILLFAHELNKKEILKKLIIITGAAYVFVTFSYYYFSEHYVIGLSTVSMIVCIIIITSFELVFYDLESAFVFSALKDRDYHIIDDDTDKLSRKIDYIHVVSYEWRDDCLHLLTYTSDNQYIDINYEFLPKYFLGCRVSLDSDILNRFTFEAEMHKLERYLSTNTRI